MVNINDLSENVVYMFAVQAVNDGGSGNITNYRSGVFCFTSKRHINYIASYVSYVYMTI